VRRNEMQAERKPWMWTEGQRVQGTYYGHSFVGNIKRISQSTANHLTWKIVVQLDAPQTFFGCEVRDFVPLTWGETGTLEPA
jgi:hypothetical protein